MSGKSSLLQNMLIKSYVHKFKPENVYIFSRTASYDMAYRPLLKWLCEHSSKSNEPGGTPFKPKIFEKIDMKAIEAVVES